MSKYYPRKNQFPSRKVNTAFTQHLFKLRAENKKLKAQVLAKSKRDHERLFERQTIVTEWSARPWTREEKIELATECLLAFENELTWPNQTPEELARIRGMIAWERKELKILEHEGEIEKLKEELAQAWVAASAMNSINEATIDKLEEELSLKNDEIKAQCEVIAEKDQEIHALEAQNEDVHRHLGERLIQIIKLKELIYDFRASSDEPFEGKRCKNRECPVCQLLGRADKALGLQPPHPLPYHPVKTPYYYHTGRKPWWCRMGFDEWYRTYWRLPSPDEARARIGGPDYHNIDAYRAWCVVLENAKPREIRGLIPRGWARRRRPARLGLRSRFGSAL